MTIDELIKNLVGSSPAVIILLWVIYNMSQGHKDAVRYYRSDRDRLLRLMEKMYGVEDKSQPPETPQSPPGEP